jgi:hypothetical protein
MPQQQPPCGHGYTLPSRSYQFSFYVAPKGYMEAPSREKLMVEVANNQDAWTCFWKEIEKSYPRSEWDIWDVVQHELSTPTNTGKEN